MVFECPWIQPFTQTRRDKSIHRKNNVSQVELMMVDVAVLISTNSNPSVYSADLNTIIHIPTVKQF